MSGRYRRILRWLRKVDVRDLPHIREPLPRRPRETRQEEEAAHPLARRVLRLNLRRVLRDRLERGTAQGRQEGEEAPPLAIARDRDDRDGLAGFGRCHGLPYFVMTACKR